MSGGGGSAENMDPALDNFENGALLSPGPHAIYLQTVVLCRARPSL